MNHVVHKDEVLSAMITNDREARRPALSLRNVGVYYRQKGNFWGGYKRKFWALKDVSFELFEGETLGIVGRNGAGKTTLLKVLAGIIRPDVGTLINNGYCGSLLSLQVGFLPYLNGRENAILSGILLGLHRHEVEDRMNSIISLAELEEHIDQPVKNYSVGMKTRLGFSVAIHVDPDILLVDEVLAVGDAEFHKKSSAIMREKIRSDKSVVLVSHNPSLIQQYCDRAVWIDKGRSVMEGDPNAVLKAYQQSQQG